jgi:dTDP-4-dehydrorhamnose 3,5-epimerase
LKVDVLAIRNLPLPGLKVVEYLRRVDRRGYFAEIAHVEAFKDLAPALGCERLDFVQANESRSKAGVLRGLHFQVQPAMGKLVRLVYGRAVDMALDVRPNSPTCGQLFLVDMTVDPASDRGRWIWLPPGLAHGNFYLEDSAIEYFCTAVYNPAGEVGLNPLDPSLDWRLCEPALAEAFAQLKRRGFVASDRDLAGLTWPEWLADPRAAAFGGGA